MVEPSRKRRHAAAMRSGPLLELGAHAPLLDAIGANPTDPAPWMVYADLLQTVGHPRGELISLMMERERRPSARLLELQRGELGLHAAALLPSALAPDVVVAWRRGFVSELRLDAPEQLAEVKCDLSLRFVEAATLTIDPENWSEWRAALTAARMPWRRLQIETDTDLELAPILACVPALQTLRIAFSPEASGTLIWDDAVGAELELLVLVNAGEVLSLDDAELPRLAELRLLGNSMASDELRTSLRWSRLKRVVLAASSDEEDEEGDGVEASDFGPVVRVTAPLAGDVSDVDDADDDYDYDGRDPMEPTIAFVVVGQLIEPALLRKLATRMSITHLSARVVTVRRLPQPVTVIQFFGTAEAELLPYGLAVALEHVLAPAPPIALIEIDGDRAARYLVLGDTPVRGTKDRPDDVVRRALDLALGYDPGSSILHDLLDELGATPIEHLVGDGGASQLTMVDPSTAPLVVPDDETDEQDYDDEEDEFGDGDEYDFDEGEAEQYEEPVAYELDDEDERTPTATPAPVQVVDANRAAPRAATEAANATIEAATAASAVVVEVTQEDPVDDGAYDVVNGDPPEDDEQLATTARTDDEDALAAPPERSELWLEFREHWDDRAIAIDDEESELRWPDPERLADEELHLERQVAEPTCARHMLALEYCQSCSALHCVECGGEDWCATCFAVLVDTTPLDDPWKRVR